MATITSREFSLSIEFTQHGEDFVAYYFSLTRNGVPVINPRIYDGLTRAGQKLVRGAGADDTGENLIAMLQWALKNNQATYWEPIEPDVTLAIYPDDVFPLGPAHRKIVRVDDPFEQPGPELAPNEMTLWTSEEADEEDAKYLAKKEALGGKHPDDPVCLILSISDYVFGGGAYSHSGPAMILHPSRREVSAFVRALKREFRKLKKTSARISGSRAFTQASPVPPADSGTETKDLPASRSPAQTRRQRKKK
jgi:hypothetical protein